MMLLPPPTKQHRLRWLIVVSVSALISVRMAPAFTSVASRQCVISRYQPSSRKYAAEPEQPSSKSTTSTLALSASLIDDAKLLIENSIRNTDRGRSVNPHELKQINTHISSLESLCPLSEPARDLRMGGMWEVLYTDAPPPSNGQLGFFKGVAMQVIDLTNKRYRNELYVGGNANNSDNVNNGDRGASAINVDDAWLTAVLDAEWAEWDGVFLDSPKVQQQQQQQIVDCVDHGATTWKVTFASITFILFKIPIFTKKFDNNTSRTWKMTYLDDETRIVRAGRTGRGDDDYVFYMKRRW